MFVDIIVMKYYVSRLMSVVIMQGEVSYVQTQGETPQIETSNIELTKPGDTVQAVVREQEDGEVLSATTVTVSHKLVRTITKTTLLSLIGILTSFWLHLEMMASGIKGDTEAVLYRAIASIDGAVNIICMYLIFAFARPYYDIGCKWCHIGMSKCCLFVTKKAVLKAKQKNEI
eukprot:266927_1